MEGTFTPSDQMGDIDRPPWAGLFLSDIEITCGVWQCGADNPQSTPIIMVVQPDFTVEMFVYKTEQEMRAAWSALEQTIVAKNPRDHDVVVDRSGLGNRWRIRLVGPVPFVVQAAIADKDEAVSRAKRYISLSPVSQQLWLFEDGEYFLLEK